MSGISGIIPILLTPFHPDETIDYGSLRLEVDMALKAGVHGIGIGIGSEIFKLTPLERIQMLRAVADQVAGEIPVIMNTSAPGTEIAVRLAADAAGAGATRLMIWPPDFFATGPDAVVAHLTRITAEAGLPIVLQDVPQSPISPALALRIAQDVPLADTIKVETLPTVEQVATMVKVAGNKLTILGGAGGGTLVEEFRRGAKGTMPFVSQSLPFMAAWNALQSGNEAAAEVIIEEQILPVSRLASQGRDLFYHVHKAMLQRCRVFRGTTVRMPTALPDAITQGEIQRLIDRMTTQP